MPATPGTFSTNALKSELQSDPAGMGYASFVAKAQDQAVADLLNSLTSPGATAVWRNDVKVSEIINQIVAADFAGLTQLQVLQLILILTTGILDATQTQLRTIFTNIFTGKATTLSNLNTVAQRTGSRAEALWGTGFVVTPDQIAGTR